MLSARRSAVVVNTHDDMPPQFIWDPDMDYPVESMLDELRRHSRPDGLATLDATRLASALLGDSIAANVFLLGFAFQKGLIPLSSVALYRALELFGRNVEMNKRTFDWGRYTAAEPERVLELAGTAEPPAVSATAEELIEYRASFLVDYQDEAYASRYRDCIERVGAKEREVAGDETSLVVAAAKSYFKLLAYKDEYEVARLYSDGRFQAQLKRQFAGEPELKVYLAPPLLAERDPDTGHLKKRAYGPWMLTAFTYLARLRRLRGTWLDPFGRSEDRRTERRLITEYEAVLEELLQGVSPDNHALAVEIARVPEQIRGYGHVKARHLQAAKAREAELLAAFRQPPEVRLSAAE